MGSCLSVRIKAESPLHDGMVSSASVPPTPKSQDEILKSCNLKSFGYDELRVATLNFQPDDVFREGHFGCFFKGWIDEITFTAARPGTGMVITAKILTQEGYQGHKEWLVTFSSQSCKIGWILPWRLAQDSGSSYCQPLSWSLRMKVALGAAKGLAYLHSSKAKVIYRDFKSSNILIDSLSDFGLARDGPVDGKIHVSTRVMGTYGYAAPEYMVTGHLTARSDVYSFGVVLLEMLTGRRAVDTNRPQGEHNLVMWAKPCLTSKRKIFKVMDARIEGQYSLVGAVRAATIAVKCLSTEPKLRPRMDEVVEALEQLQDLKDYGSVRSESVKRHPVR
ncbi:hypothetical protein RJ640_001611 [Escallonia rubra]|uniref:Protein kinase domain-containing protein n=1 Tax=Escallonia rubra TaxID=112253 RepID=A0AA88Q8E1_9ASTE|nr:hypothetical protein RJ640_001611 [Escallonia rubra]